MAVKKEGLKIRRRRKKIIIGIAVPILAIIIAVITLIIVNYQNEKKYAGIKGCPYCDSKYNIKNEEAVVKDKVIYWTGDYPVKYKDVFDGMFASNWRVIEETEMHMEATYYYGYPSIYKQWIIEYYDGNNERQTIILNNLDALRMQIENQLRIYIKDYYVTNFYNPHLGNTIPLEGTNNLYVKSAIVTRYEDTAKYRAIKKKGKKYEDNLLTAEGCIKFSEITPANVFSYYPASFSFGVNVTDKHYEDNPDIEEYVKNQAKLIFEEMNAFTGNKLNARFVLSRISQPGEKKTLSDGSYSWNYYYVDGKQADCEESYIFDEMVFDSYVGVFW